MWAHVDYELMDAIGEMPPAADGAAESDDFGRVPQVWLLVEQALGFVAEGTRDSDKGVEFVLCQDLHPRLDDESADLGGKKYSPIRSA